MENTLETEVVKEGPTNNMENTLETEVVKEKAGGMHYLAFVLFTIGVLSPIVKPFIINSSRYNSIESYAMDYLYGLTIIFPLIALFILYTKSTRPIIKSASLIWIIATIIDIITNMILACFCFSVEEKSYVPDNLMYAIGISTYIWMFINLMYVYGLSILLINLKDTSLRKKLYFLLFTFLLPQISYSLGHLKHIENFDDFNMFLYTYNIFEFVIKILSIRAYWYLIKSDLYVGEYIEEDIDTKELIPANRYCIGYVLTIIITIATASLF